MKRVFILCLGFFTFFLTANAVYAETDIAISGQVRIRHETDQKRLVAEDVTQDFTDMRTRVMLEATVKENTHAVVQFQDSRRFGGQTYAGAPASSQLNDGKNVDVHQAYIQIDRLFSVGWGMKAGRFELNLGNQRAFGAVGWSNVGRAWEGAQGWYDNPAARVTGYWLKRLELNDEAGNRDFDVYGVNAVIKNAGVEVFLFYEYDADDRSPFAAGTTYKTRRGSLGTYFNRTYGRMDFTGNGIYQFGTLNNDHNGYSEHDISAFLITMETGYTFPGSGKARIAGGIDYASGDDNPYDEEWNAYDNLYYTGHKFRGYMDYFIASELTGLVDLMLGGRIAPHPGWALNGTMHHFMRTAGYTDYRGVSTKDVGTEVDLGVSTTTVPGVNLAAGSSIFLPTESFAGMENPDTKWWLYVMMTAEFK